MARLRKPQNPTLILKLTTAEACTLASVIGAAVHAPDRMRLNLPQQDVLRRLLADITAGGHKP